MPKMTFKYTYTADWVLDRVRSIFSGNPRVTVIITKYHSAPVGALKIKVATKKELGEAHRVIMADEILREYFVDPEIS